MNRAGFLKLAAVVAASPWYGKVLQGVDWVGTMGPNATTIDVSGGYFYVGDIIRFVPTGEAMRVTAISGRTLSIVRCT